MSCKKIPDGVTQHCKTNFVIAHLVKIVINYNDFGSIWWIKKEVQTLFDNEKSKGHYKVVFMPRT